MSKAIKDEMTSLERVVAALNYQKPDRVPTAPLVCGASSRVLGVTYDKWSTDAEACTKSFLQAQELIGFDAFVTLIDLSVEAADFGQKVIYPTNSTAYSDTNNSHIREVEDYYKLERINPRETPRMKLEVDVIRGLSKAKGNEVAITGFLYGPLGVLSQLRGHDRLFMDCIKHPEAVMAAQEVITEVLCEYARAQAEAGAHSICLDTLYASQSIMSKKMWEKIEAPYAAKVAQAIKDTGCVLSLHNCGNGIYFDAQEKWLDPVAISHAYPADDCKTWEEHVAKWGKKIVTIGYGEPSSYGLFFTEEQAIEDSRRMIEEYKDCDGGFILATGCEYPPNGTLMNAIAMVKASKMYGRY